MPLTVVNTVEPIKITGTTSADTEILPDNVIVHIRFIRWYNPATSGDLCHITDGQGVTIIKMRADVDNDTQMWPIFKTYSGIRSDDMDSGELYIHRQ